MNKFGMQIRCHQEQARLTQILMRTESGVNPAGLRGQRQGSRRLQDRRAGTTCPRQSSDPAPRFRPSKQLAGLTHRLDRTVFQAGLSAVPRRAGQSVKPTGSDWATLEVERVIILCMNADIIIIAFATALLVASSQSELTADSPHDPDAI
jgi:hypothetical protein